MKQILEILMEFDYILSFFRIDTISEEDEAGMGYVCLIKKAKDEGEEARLRENMRGGQGSLGDEILDTFEEMKKELKTELKSEFERGFQELSRLIAEGR